MRPSSSGLLLLLVLASGCEAPEGSVTGRVTWAGTAAGEGIDVTLFGPVTRSTRTDAEGSWSLRQLPPGEYVAVAEASETLEHSVTTNVRVLDRRHVEAEPLTLTQVGKISGVVTLTGAATSEGASVLVLGGAGAAQTAADGSFLLTAIAAGKRDLWIYAPGFQPSRVSAVEVHRGVTTPLPPIALVPVETGTGPLVGALRGRAWLPGTDDHTGIQVEVTGTGLQTLTAADGSFVFDEVPSGVVALSFRKDTAAAELGRVLVVAGGNGFIIDQGLYDLGAQPVPLRRGKRLLAGEAGPWAIAPGGQWAILRSAQPVPRLWLFGADAGIQPLTDQHQTGFASLGFDSSSPPKVYWFYSFDPGVAAFSLNQVVLATGVSTSFAQLPNSYDFRFAIAGTGAAWVHDRTLWVRASPAVPVSELFATTATSVAPLGEDTVLVTAAGALHEVRLDGTILRSLPVLAAADWLVASADGRWVVVGTGGRAGVPVGPASMLIDRTLWTAATLPSSCPYPRFSPASDLLLCTTQLHRLARDGTISSQAVPQGSGQSQWLPGGRVAFAVPPALRIVAPGQAELVLTGISWDSYVVTPSTDGTRIKLLANVDPASGLGQAIEVTLADGSSLVLAEGVATRPFAANDRGVVVGRPRTVGTDLDLFYVPGSGLELALGRTAKTYGNAISRSASSTFFGIRRFAPGRGYESVVLDTRGGPDPQLPIAIGYTSDRWLDDRRLLQAVTRAAPFRDASGLYLVELP